MILKSLHLVNFKNYPELSLDFSEKVNCIAGNNGTGKTNLLDAIHYLALCKSYFHPTDSQHIRQGEQMFVIQGDFRVNGNDESVFCGVRQGQKKVFKRNMTEYDKLSEHIGLLPVVMVAPVDQEIITGGSEERRKFIDSIISQTDREYLRQLIHYNRLLAQRNALLKQTGMKQRPNYADFEIWDEQLVPAGEKIFEKRKSFCAQFVPLLEEIYSRLSAKKEPVDMIYESDLSGQAFALLLKNAFSRDIALQYTSCGTHKDDITFCIQGVSARKYASQGQQKTFVVALKLAQYEVMRIIKGTKPILMLDDIFDKLDESRVSNLMELVSEERFGQLFITDTHSDRVAEIFNRINVAVKRILVENGVVFQEAL